MSTTVAKQWYVLLFLKTKILSPEAILFSVFGAWETVDMRQKIYAIKKGLHGNAEESSTQHLV